MSISQPFSRPHQLVTVSMDTTAKLWDVQQQACLATFTHHNRSVHACAAHASAPLMFTGSRDHTIRMWDLRAPPAQCCAAVLTGHSGSITSLAVDDCRLLSAGGYNRAPDGEEVLSVDSTIRLWDIRGAAHTAVARASGGHGAVWRNEPSGEGGGGGGGGGQGGGGGGGGGGQGEPGSAVTSAVTSAARHAAFRPDSPMVNLWSAAVPRPAAPLPGLTDPRGDPVLDVQLLGDGCISSHGDGTMRFWPHPRWLLQQLGGGAH
jgi:hypothetical protein